MPAEEPPEPVGELADRAMRELNATPTAAQIDNAAALLPKLRNQREFVQLSSVAELVGRYRPRDQKVRRLHAQGLIECGRLTVATALLEGVLTWTHPEDAEYPELQGLLGRAYKQLFIETNDPGRTVRESYIRKASDAYRAAYETNPARLYWHGINLCALAYAAQSNGIHLGGPSSAEYGQKVLSSLLALPEAEWDEWWHATKAEAHIALGQWPEAETDLGAYIRAPRVEAFHIASTLRQLREIWAIQSQSETGARLLQILEAELSHRPGGQLTVDSSHLVAMRDLQSIDEAQVQRLVGPSGMATLNWYRMGLQRAGCVAALCERLGLRFGTGFAVRSGDFGIEPNDEVLLLTNWHVLNSSGLGGQSNFSNVEVVFEAAAQDPLRLKVRSVVAESPVEGGGLDYALLRLQGPTHQLETIDLTDNIGDKSKARVYVIGYPLGEALQFSLQDNLLTDHECPPSGTPPYPERRRVQYSAATEKGSSGSPVFDEYWNCIALHHAGGKRDPQRGNYGIAALNGGRTLIEANEGIWIQSIRDHVRAKHKGTTS